MKQIINFIKTIGGKKKVTAKEPVRVIHPGEIFLSVIRRETSRYNRNKRPFSVISLDISPYVTDKNSIDNVIQNISSRIRISDDIGWLTDTTVGLLLAETDRDGTESLVQSLLDTINTEYADIILTVYHYPSSEWPDMFL